MDCRRGASCFVRCGCRRLKAIQECHKPVLAAQVAALWHCYFAPENDEKPLQRGAAPPVIRADLKTSPGRKLLLVDATLGEAAHARLLLQEQAHLVGIDADAEMLERAKYFLDASLGAPERKRRCRLIHQNFGDYFAALEPGQLNADLILFDLGLSLFHYRAGRGFSFRPEDPDELLDMRLDPSVGPSAAELIESLGESELADIFWRYGELRHAGHIARQIVRARTQRLGRSARGQRLARSTHDLREARSLREAKAFADFIRQITPAKVRHKMRIHPATQVFQALRIAVGDELGRLQRSLPKALEQLRRYGLLAVVSFHSLEDRLIKKQFRSWQAEGRVQWVYKKAIQADYQSPLQSERSAKLRVVRKMITN